jgi:hypothetical protein
LPQIEEGDVIKVGCGPRLQGLVAMAIEGTERNIPCELLYCTSSLHPPSYDSSSSFHVGTLHEPIAADITREAEQDAADFAEAVNADRLLTTLRNLDISRENITGRFRSYITHAWLSVRELTM